MNSPEELTILASCPFCGCAAAYYGAAVRCTSFKCNAGLSPDWTTKAVRSAQGDPDERLRQAQVETAERWNRRASHAAPAPSDRLVSVGKASGLVEARVSLAARQIRQSLRDYGHRCAETSLPDLIAADVDAALRKQDEIHAPAPSDGLREAVARGLDGYTIEDGTNAAFTRAVDAVVAALSPAPTQEGGRRHD